MLFLLGQVIGSQLPCWYGVEALMDSLVSSEKGSPRKVVR